MALKELPFFKMQRYDSHRALVFYRKHNEVKMGYANEEGNLVFYAEKKSQF